MKGRVETDQPVRRRETRGCGVLKIQRKESFQERGGDLQGHILIIGQ